MSPEKGSTMQIPTPDYPNRAGVAASETARLAFVALFCVFQYWLLTATLEAYQQGNVTLPLGAFIASVGCFLLAAGLVAVGEFALFKQQKFLRSIRAGNQNQLNTMENHKHV